MNRFLNRLPTITIREGHRVKVYLTSDLELPAYGAGTDAGLVRREGGPCVDDSSLFGILGLGLAAAPAHAQLVVIDPGNLAQAVLIAQRAQRALRGAAGAVPDDPAHGAGPRQHGAAIASRRSRSRATIPAAGCTAGRWLQGLNSGDADRRARTGSTTLPLERPTRAAGRTVAGRAPRARAAVRHHRDHRFRRDDGRPSGRRSCAATTGSCSRPSRRSKATCSTACCATTR